MLRGKHFAEWNSVEGLNNTDETVKLPSPDASMQMAVASDDDDGWSTAPDGQGPSLEWFEVGLANDATDSWTFSLVFGGTPGAAISAWGLCDPE